MLFRSSNGFSVTSGSVKLLSLTTSSLSISGSLTVNSTASFNGHFYYNGNKQYNYGQFSDSTTQSGSVNVSSSFNLNTTTYSQGISITSGSRITFANGGFYKIDATTTVTIANATTNVYLWLRKNGTTNVANSAVTFQGRANNTEMMLNQIVSASANDYFEIMKQWDANTPTTFNAVAASGNIPVVPSIIVTVNQVA